MEPTRITWVSQSNGNLPQFSVVAGIDSKRKLYVARAHHNGGVIPGKLHIGHTGACIPYGGQEHFKTEYEILTVPMGTVSWVDYDGSSIPLNAIQAGNDPNGAAYYIGRVIHQGTVTVGKVHRVGNQGTCFIPYGGKEHGYSRNYEILVRNAMGRHLAI